MRNSARHATHVIRGNVQKRESERVTDGRKTSVSDTTHVQLVVLKPKGKGESYTLTLYGGSRGTLAPKPSVESSFSFVTPSFKDVTSDCRGSSTTEYPC